MTSQLVIDWPFSKLFSPDNVRGFFHVHKQKKKSKSWDHESCSFKAIFTLTQSLSCFIFEQIAFIAV